MLYIWLYCCFLYLQSLVHLKLALRVCASFRGCYLDYKEKADTILRSQREKREHTTTEQEQYGYTHRYNITMYPTHVLD